ncbi:MAG: hypothetical protein IKH54_01410 [Bacilli bacterium]|nr:hypothetical protein [Bacilli bacterium]
MNNDDSCFVITDNKKKISFLIIFIIIIIVFFVIIGFRKIVYDYGFHSTDLKNDQQVNDYLVKYMNDKYNIDATLSLKKKELIYICTFRMIDGSCMDQADNKNIYEYEFDGVDNNGNNFVINYTNSYIGKYKKYDSKIIENYKIYDARNNIEAVLSRYSKNVDIYTIMNDEDIVYDVSKGVEEYADNYLIIRMLVDKIDVDSIVELTNEMEEIDEVSNIFITSDQEVYDKILSSNNSSCSDCQIFQKSGFVHPNILTNRFGYTYMQKNYDVSHYFLNEFKKIDFDNDSMYYSIIYYASSFHIYEKLQQSDLEIE